jgi:hypothetical protein
VNGIDDDDDNDDKEDEIIMQAIDRAIAEEVEGDVEDAPEVPETPKHDVSDEAAVPRPLRRPEQPSQRRYKSIVTIHTYPTDLGASFASKAKVFMTSIGQTRNLISLTSRYRAFHLTIVFWEMTI